MKNIAIFYPEPHIDTNPTMVESIQGFVQSGYSVDVFTTLAEAFPKPCWNNKLIRTFRINGSPKGEKELLNEDACRQHREGKYAVIIGCDPDGIIAAHAHSLAFRLPLVYLSFEIFFWDELITEEDKLQKKKEIEACKHVNVVIIQDHVRAELLSKENNIDLSKFVLLPVAPKGPARMDNSDFLRRRFNIEKDRIIVLHTGGFEPRTFGHELVASAQNWPDNFVLVIHTRCRDENDQYLLEARKKNDPSKVIFSTEPVSYSSYEKLVNSCDIGLVLQTQGFTKYSQKNVYHIGLSSGKLSFYTKFGKPVITNNLPTYENLINAYGAGRVISEIAEMPKAINEILEDYSRIAQNSVHLFEEKLRWDRYFPKVLEKLENDLG